MTEDLYSEILETNVPNHYQLMGLQLFETDPEKIHQAGLEQMKKLKAWDLHEDEATAKKVKEMHVQLSLAISELGEQEKKEAYDKKLGEELGIPVTYLGKEPSRLKLHEKIEIKSQGPGEKTISFNEKMP